MKRYPILILITILMLVSGLSGGCTANLPEDEKASWYAMGDVEGFKDGHWLAVVASEVDIKETYIPKGYLSIEDFSDTHFADGTPFNEKQKEQAIKAYNWGFYDGFCRAVDEVLTR